MVNDSNIITIDSIESKMKVNKFSGNRSQETREGYNLWDYLNVVKASAGGLTIEKDYENGYIIVNGTPNENYVYISSSIFITDMLEDGQRYTLWQEIYGGEGTTDGIYLQVTRTADNETTVRYYSRNNSASFLVDKSNNASYSITLQTSSVDGTGTLTNYRNRYMLYKGTDEKSYELPGASPSLDYPSEVRAVGDNVNIFPDDLYNYFSSNQNAIKELNGKEFKITTIANRYSGIYLNSNNDFYKDLTNKIKEKIVTYSFDVKADSDIQLLFGTKGYETIRNVNNNWQRLQVTYEKNEPGIYFYNSSATVTTFYIRNIKLIFGEGDNSYSPHGQGSVEVKKINKNWAKIDTPRTVKRGGLNIEVDNEGVFTLNGTTTANMYINLLDISEYQNTTLSSYKIPVKKYKAYFELISKNNSDGSVFLNVRNFAASSVGEQATTYCAFDNLIAEDVGIQIKDCNITKDRVVAYLYIASGAKLDDFKFRFALYNEDETDTTFEEHQEQSYVLPIQKPMLSGDYFDLERGKEVHKWIERELTGTENITLTDTVNGIAQFTFSQFYDGDYDTGSVNINALSNCYKGVPHQSSWLKDNSIALVGGYTARIMTSEYSTVEEFKQMLAEKYAEGNPVKIYYKLIKPKELGLTSEQITVLNELQNIILYDDTTNILLPDVYPILDYDVSKIIDTTTTFEASLDSNGYFVVPDYDIKCLISYSESDIPSMPEAVETSVSVPGRDGDIPLNTIYNPISFTIVCYTEDNLTPEEKYAEETKMNKFLNSIKNNTIKLKLESKGKYYDVKYNGQLTTINYPKHLQFSIPLKSSSSYAKDIDESYILGNGEKESSTIKEVGAVFVIEGPAQTPKISLNDYEMFYDNVLLFNTKLVIDSNKSTVTMINREGTATNAMRYYNHEFPKIQNGNNVLKVLSGIDEDRQVNVRWFDLKL